MSNLYRRPSKDASYQISIHLAKWLQRGRFFRNQPVRNKNCLWQPCLLTDQDEISNLYRGPAIDASYQVLVHFAKRFQRRRLKKNRPIRNKNCLWGPWLLMAWPPQAILVSDWLISKQSSPLKPLGHMNRNFVGSILGRSSIKTAHLVPIR
jgi:hypothetical protein